MDHDYKESRQAEPLAASSPVGEACAAAREQDGAPDPDRPTTTFPIIGEELEVRTRVIDTGGIRITKSVAQRVEIVDQPLVREEVVVERVPVDQMLADMTPPPIRQEGDTTIIPLFEEVLVVEKRLRIKEELHVRRVKHESHAHKEVTLRTEKVSVRKVE